MTRDGRPIGVDFQTTLIRDGDRIVGVQGIARDITERRQAEKAAQRSRQEAEALASIARDLSSSLEREDVLRRIVEDARTLTMSDLSYVVVREPGDEEEYHVLAQSGARSSAILGRWYDVPSTLGGGVLATGQPARTDDYLTDPRFGDQYRGVLKDEGIRSMAVVPVRVGSGIAALLFVGHHSLRPYTDADMDLLTRLAGHAAVALSNASLYTALAGANADLEQAVRRANELAVAAEEANRAKSAFLANMSHEPRTPMNAILGYNEMLAEEATDLGQESFIPDLKKINAVGRHLLELINSVLDLSKIEAGKMDLYLETFDVGSLVNDVSAILQPLLEKNRNTWFLRCPLDIGEMRADVTKVRQALFNLLSNASKFAQRGSVSLLVSREQGPTGDWINFAVTDTGHRHDGGTDGEALPGFHAG